MEFKNRYLKHSSAVVGGPLLELFLTGSVLCKESPDNTMSTQVVDARDECCLCLDWATSEACRMK